MKGSDMRNAMVHFFRSDYAPVNLKKTHIFSVAHLIFVLCYGIVFKYNIRYTCYASNYRYSSVEHNDLSFCLNQTIFPFIIFRK